MIDTLTDDDLAIPSSPLDARLLLWLDVHEPHGPIDSKRGAWNGSIVALECNSCGARVEPDEDHYEADVQETLGRLPIELDPTWISDRPGEIGRIISRSEIYSPDWYRERVRRGIFWMCTRAGDTAVAAAVADVRAQLAAGILCTPEDVRLALRCHVQGLKPQFPHLHEEEPWEHLAMAFEDIIPADVESPVDWLGNHELDGTAADEGLAVLETWLDDSLPGYPEGITDPTGALVAERFIGALEIAMMMLGDHRAHELLRFLQYLNEHGLPFFPVESHKRLAQLSSDDFTRLVARQIGNVLVPWTDHRDMAKRWARGLRTEESLEG